MTPSLAGSEVPLKPLRLLTLLLTLFMVAVPALPAGAWVEHELMTREMLRPVTWLNQYRNLVVTKWTYEVEDQGPYHPDFQPIYLDKLVGEKTSAREILLRYVDEPDWGMDDGMELSPLQAIASGSHGYRHQRLSYLHQVVQIGEAPKRAEACYQLSMTAFRKGDPYWGFRYMARSLHYLQDCGDPLYTRAFRWPNLMDIKFEPRRLQTQILNTRHLYDAFVAYQLRAQQVKGKGPWLAQIKDAKAADVFSARAAAEALANFIGARADKTVEACEHFWPRKARSQKTVQPIREDALHPAEPPPSYATLMEDTGADLMITTRMVRGLLARARQDIKVQTKPPEDE